MYPYIIYAPGYDRTSNGIVVLYKLCHELNERGYKAYVPALNNSGMETPPASIDEMVDLIGQGAIVVYPETVVGNPLYAPKVVRWILNTPGYFGGDTEFPNEMIFSFNKVFYDADILQMSTIDIDLFKDEGLTRNGELSYVGKGIKDFDVLPEIPPTTEITKQQTKQELAHLFKTSTLLHSFDAFTQLNMEAVLCGCPVVVYPSNRVAKDKPIKGISLGLDGVQTARDEIQLARNEYLEYLNGLPAQLDNFITKTQNYEKETRI